MSSTKLQCACAQVRIEVTGAPILNAECHCTSCRAAAAKLQALPKAPTIQEPNGGTQFVLYRKDRVRFLDGMELLKAFRLSSESGTRRVVATCCNTPVFLEFEKGHWLSLYACMWPAAARPTPDVRTMTIDRAEALVPDHIPSSKRQSLGFMAKLLRAWIAMKFRAPKIAITGTLEL